MDNIIKIVNLILCDSTICDLPLRILSSLSPLLVVNKDTFRLGYLVVKQNGNFQDLKGGNGTRAGKNDLLGKLVLLHDVSQIYHDVDPFVIRSGPVVGKRDRILHHGFFIF